MCVYKHWLWVWLLSELCKKLKAIKWCAAVTADQHFPKCELWNSVTNVNFRSAPNFNFLLPPSPLVLWLHINHNRGSEEESTVDPLKTATCSLTIPGSHRSATAVMWWSIEAYHYVCTQHSSTKIHLPAGWWFWCCWILMWRVESGDYLGTADTNE